MILMLTDESMTDSSLKDRMKNNFTINAWLTIPHPWVAELAAHAGLDMVTLDMQHGLIDYPTAIGMLQATSITKIPTLVRTPWNEPVYIMRMLDAGARGIVCPMVNTRHEAEQFVSMSRYPPLGTRSYGPIRANPQKLSDYVHRANSEIITLAQIETVEGLTNLDEILAVDGLDGVYVGTIDLSISMGLKDHGNLANPELREVVQGIAFAAQKAGKIVGIHAMDPSDVEPVTSWGYRLITPINDTSVLKQGFTERINQTRTTTKDSVNSKNR